MELEEHEEDICQAKIDEYRFYYYKFYFTLIATLFWVYTDLFLLYLLVRFSRPSIKE